MTTGYPWSVLGIAPTDDAKAVRRAYALKLRETRPDEDPAGFQKLVEARDAALAGHAAFSAFDDASIVVAQSTERETAAAAFETTTLENEASISDAVLEKDSAPPVGEGAADVALAKLSQSLQAIDTKSSASDLRIQWKRAFAAFDDVPLECDGLAMHWLLHRLVSDMRAAIPEMRSVTDMTNAEVARFRNGPFNVYVDIVRDFDAHFRLAQHDMVVFDFLAQEDGFYLIEAFSFALRQPSDGGEKVKPSKVPFIPESYLKAGFAADGFMLQYYRNSVTQGRCESSFSIQIALFSLPFALYFRLSRLSAALCGIAAVMVAFLNSTNEQVRQFLPLVILIYCAVSLAVGAQWRGLRVGALSARIDRFVAKGLSHDEIVGRLKKWSGRDVTVLKLGRFAAVLLWAAVVFGRNRFYGGRE